MPTPNPFQPFLDAPVKLPVSLEATIIQKLREEELSQLRHRVWLLHFGFTTSLLSLLASALILYKDALLSGFMTTFSLLFSDATLVFQHGTIFAWSLVESLPWLPTAVFLALAALVMRLLKGMLQERAAMNSYTFSH